jgi:hypothetical protein
MRVGGYGQFPRMARGRVEHWETIMPEMTTSEEDVCVVAHSLTHSVTCGIRECALIDTLVVSEGIPMLDDVRSCLYVWHD